MANPGLYTVGGTVQAGEGIYIPRLADQELLQLCRERVFAYVLTPRQMGKSSLMVQTAERLQAEGVRTAIVDLQDLGAQVTAEQWYFGFLVKLEDQLELETDVVSWWEGRSHLGVSQRLTMFFEQVLLREIAEPVVIFVDEIDSTLSLDFTDDFFIAIRSLYVTRATQPEFGRLSFVLIGVATPGDLIRDARRTPFNIGQQVDLTDFARVEAMPLAAGLGLAETEAEQALGWVLHWTGGHPYLTQRLCQEMARVGGAQWTEVEVGRLVGRTFLGAQSEQDNNLQFVRTMLTKRAPDLVSLLTVYREIHRGHRNTPEVLDDKQSLVKSHLKLSGVVHSENGILHVRNLIYREVFDVQWIDEHLPIDLTNFFYVVGGTVQAGRGIYITRQADGDLLEICRRRAFAYILTPRQMGKSSLMVHVAERLAAEGVQVGIVDLQDLGAQVTAEQWYFGFLVMLEDQLELETDVVSWWQGRSHLGVSQRLMMFFEQVLLKEIAEPVVIFVDEIDSTLSLDFTDDFFTAIRALYLIRATQPEFHRLSFVLFGVATPGDLIQDVRRTPFNIGQQVDLTDFTLVEAMPLAAGLGLAEAEQALGWVLQWTGGHPYLTQRLCQEMARVGGAQWTEAEVGRLVGRTFLGAQSERDNHLQFVRNMLTKQAAEPVAVLKTYQQIWNGKPVVDEEQSLVKSHLKLAGVVKREGKTLQVRNRIYRQVFDRRWIREHLPENLWQRLKPAIPIIATLLIAFIGMTGFALYANQQRLIALDALQAREIAQQQLARTQEQTQSLKQLCQAIMEQREINEQLRLAVEKECNSSLDRTGATLF